MNDNRSFSSPFLLLLAFLFLGVPSLLGAQGTLTDYERADSFNARTQGLVVGIAETPTWVG
ncbi:MAG: hypothetical protein HKO65_04905, partial [Gemmatimonadetes bacterium]|nr:hypothetical protein [Gemmatimonadota bacterium]